MVIGLKQHCPTWTSPSPSPSALWTSQVLVNTETGHFRIEKRTGTDRSDNLIKPCYKKGHIQISNSTTFEYMYVWVSKNQIASFQKLKIETGMAKGDTDFWKFTTGSLSNQTSPNAVNLLIWMWSFLWWVHFQIDFTSSAPIFFSIL